MSSASSSASSCFATNRQALKSSAHGHSLPATICCLQPHWKGVFSLGDTRLTSSAVPFSPSWAPRRWLNRVSLLASPSAPRGGPGSRTVCGDGCRHIHVSCARSRPKARLPGGQAPRDLRSPPCSLQIHETGTGRGGYDIRGERPLQSLVMKSQRRK